MQCRSGKLMQQVRKRGKKGYLARLGKMSHKVFRNKGEFCVFVQWYKVMFKKLVLFQNLLVRI